MVDLLLIAWCVVTGPAIAVCTALAVENSRLRVKKPEVIVPEIPPQPEIAEEKLEETPSVDYTPIKIGRKSYRQRQLEYEWNHDHLNKIPTVIFLDDNPK